MNGETEFTSLLVYRFAAHHRANYGGCKTGLIDVLTGAVAYLTQIQGTAKASHVRDKITEMIHLGETLYSSSIACCGRRQTHALRGLTGGYHAGQRRQAECDPFPF